MTCNGTTNSTFRIALTSGEEEGRNGMMYRRDLALFIIIFFLIGNHGRRFVYSSCFPNLIYLTTKCFNYIKEV